MVLLADGSHLYCAAIIKKTNLINTTQIWYSVMLLGNYSSHIDDSLLGIAMEFSSWNYLRPSPMLWDCVVFVLIICKLQPENVRLLRIDQCFSKIT